MPETGENVAAEYQVSRADQDAFALRSQQRAARRRRAASSPSEIAPVDDQGRKGDDASSTRDEHPRAGHHARGAGKL